MSNRTYKLNQEYHFFDGTRAYIQQYTCLKGSNQKIFPYHNHNFFEFAIMAKNCSVLTIDGTPYTCKDNMISIIQPNMNHFQENDSIYFDNLNWSFWVYIDQNSPFVRALDGKSVIFNAEGIMPFLISALQQTETINVKSYVDIFMPAIFSAILQFYYTNKESIIHISNKSDPYMNEVLVYISQHYRDALSLDDLADHFSISKSHLLRLFNNSFGISPIKYRNQLRCCDAAELPHSMSFSEISEELHFDSLSHFSSTFTKHMGVTPQAYKQMVQPTIWLSTEADRAPQLYWDMKGE